MTVLWKKKTLLVSVFMLVLLLVIAAPVSALLRTEITLSKNYEFKHANVSFIRIPDLSDPAVSKVEILSTAGDNSDIKIIQQPTINHLTRFFSTMTGSFKGNTVNIYGDQLSTIDYTARPDYRIYTQPVVPTFKVTVPPGAMGPVAMGNPFVTKYNESWDKSDTSSLSALLRSSDIMYLYKNHGLLYQDQATPGTYYIFGPSWVDADYDTNDINFTLNNNKVSLTPFTADSTKSRGMGIQYPVTMANTGKYYAGALWHDEASRTTHILALTPMVVLKKETPILWTDDLSTSPLPQSYVKGAMGDVTLSFTGTNPDLGSITNIGYVFINSTAKYDMNVVVDTALLAQNAEDRWDSYSPGTHVVDLLYDAIRNDVGDPFTYNMTAVGQSAPPGANTFSDIAISSGYGISAKTAGTTITIPAINFSSLRNGVYYVYLMGTDANNNIVALDQGLVSIKSGAVQLPKPSTITAFTPVSGYRGTTIDYTLTGTNFESEFGNEGATVNLTKLGSNRIPTTILSLTSTKITGTVTIPAGATVGKWNVDVFTPDGGRVIKADAFEIKILPPPTITTVAPISAFKPVTVDFTVSGSNFEAGAGLTKVNFTMLLPGGTTFDNANITFTSITSAKILGTMAIGTDAPAGKWNLTVTTVHGGASALKTNALTVAPLPIPTISTVAPISAYKPGTVAFTVTGNNFETGTDLTKVNFTMLLPGGTTFDNANITFTSVTPVKILGTMVIGTDAPAGKWNLTVTTVHGGASALKTNVLTVAPLPIPMITTVTPISAYRPVTVAFTVSGSNFETGAGLTKVNFTMLNAGGGTTFDNANITFTSVTPVKILGTMVIGTDAPAGKWNLTVTTVHGGASALKVGVLKVDPLPVPAITTVTPISAYKNSTVDFTVSGSNFEAGAGLTKVNFTMLLPGGTTFDNANITFTSITPAKIIGTMAIGTDAPAGKWNLTVTTVHGGASALKVGVLKVDPRPKPTIMTFTPASSYKNSTTAFTLTGKDFQLGGGTEVQLLDVTSGTLLPITLISVTPTKILGSVAVSKDASAGSYSLVVTTVDAGSTFKANTFSVTELPVPVLMVLTPTSGYRNSSVSYSLTGKNFQLGGGTTVKLIDLSSGLQIPATLTSVTSTKVTGVINIPYNAPATSYMLAVITRSGGFATKDKAFTVKPPLAPVITTIAPTSGYKPSTVAFTLKGSNFQLGGGTKVQLVDPVPTELTATLYSVTPTEIIGSVIIPAGAGAGKWGVRVTTVDAGPVTKPLAFEVKPLPRPLISAIIPQSGVTGQVASFTVNGDYFQSRTSTKVNFTMLNAGGGTTFDNANITLSTVYPNRIIGTMAVGNDVPTGKWNLTVTTVNGGTNTSTFAFNVVVP